MKKKITIGTQARTEIHSGAKKLNSLVQSSFGPQGHGVIMAGYTGRPDIYLKGSDIAKNINFRDVNENTGAILLRSVAEEMSQRLGDGSSTAMLIAENIMEQGQKLLAAGFNPVPIRRGIEKAIPVAAEELRRMAEHGASRETAAAVATVAVHDEKIGALVAEALEQVGSCGYVSVNASDTDSCYIQKEDAYSIDSGWTSKYMANNEITQETEFDDAAIFVCGTPINSIHDILPLLNETSIKSERLLVVADSISDEVVKSFVSNIAQGTIKVCSLTVPGVGQGKSSCLEDIAAYTGTVVYGTELYPDFKNVTIGDCGRAKHIRVGRSTTYIYGGRFEPQAMEQYLEHLDALLRLDNNELEDEILRKRIANLKGNKAVVRIGAVTETERRFLTKQAEDAIKVASSGRHGILPGGATAYIRAIPAVEKFAAELSEEEHLGAKLLIGAMAVPLKKIAENAGYDGEVVCANVAQLQGAMGFDAESGSYTDMLRRGIVDSADMLVEALKVGAGLSAQFLTVDAAVLIDGTPISDLPVPDDLHLSNSDFM